MKKLLGLSVGVLAVLAVGMFLVHCGSSEETGCSSQLDCLEGEYCDVLTHECVCSPQCTGKCGGPDACGGTCADECQNGFACNADFECESIDPTCTNGDKRCTGEVAEICTNSQWTENEDCAATGETCLNGVCSSSGCNSGEMQCSGTWVQNCVGSQWVNEENCSLSGEVCLNGVCVSSGCTSGESRCNGNVIQTCVNSVWVNGVNCALTGETCLNGVCSSSGCNSGDTQCSGTWVQNCVGSQWVNDENCAATGETCVAGACQAGDQECPVNQLCEDVTGSGYFACLEDSQFPAGSQTGCDEENTCQQPNSFCINDDQGGTACLAHCGTCSTGQTCDDLNEGALGRMEGGIPANAPNCDPGDYSCPAGNYNCWSFGDPPDLYCIENCTMDGPCTSGNVDCNGDVIITCVNGSWVPGENCANSSQTCFNGACASADLCPAGQDCIDMEVRGLMQCLLATDPPNVPPNNQTGCDPANNIYCNGNFNCWDMGGADTVCLENCGSCDAGTECVEMNNGYMGCMAPAGEIPANAPNCPADGCVSNSQCWIFSEGGVEIGRFCIDHCSVPH